MTLIFDIIKVLAALILRAFFILSGLVLVPIGLLFSRPTGEWNADGWQRWHMPRLFWPWDNDRNGVAGSQFNRSINGHGKGFWWRYNWTAIRNPANNASRYLLGFSARDVLKIQYQGSALEADEFAPGRSYYRAETSRFTYPGFVWSGRIAGKWFSFYAGWKIRKNNHADESARIGFTIAFENWG